VDRLDRSLRHLIDTVAMLARHGRRGRVRTWHPKRRAASGTAGGGMGSPVPRWSGAGGAGALAPRAGCVWSNVGNAPKARGAALDGCLGSGRYLWRA
jgi:hypothetical protein